MGAVGAKPAAAASGALFEDNWTGTNGAAWDASKWTTGTQSTSTITIQNNQGRMVAQGANYVSVRALASLAATADVDVLVDLTLDSLVEQYPGVNVRGDGVWDSNNFAVQNNGYRVQLNPQGNVIQIIKCTAGTDSIIASVGLTDTTVKRVLRIQATGTTIRYRMWLATDPEPGTWDSSVTDATHATGKISLGQVNGPAATARTADFDNLIVTAP